MAAEKSPLTGAGVPIWQDDEYPALLRELAEVVQRELESTGLDGAQAGAVAETVAEHVRERFGGVPNYWPKGHTWRHRKRLTEMWADFRGNNHAELARKYGMCVQRVYYNLAVYRREVQAREQPGLFDGDGDTAAVAVLPVDPPAKRPSGAAVKLG